MGRRRLGPGGNLVVQRMANIRQAIPGGMQEFTPDRNHLAEEFIAALDQALALLADPMEGLFQPGVQRRLDLVQLRRQRLRAQPRGLLFGLRVQVADALQIRARQLCELLRARLVLQHQQILQHLRQGRGLAVLAEQGSGRANGLQAVVARGLALTVLRHAERRHPVGFDHEQGIGDLCGRLGSRQVALGGALETRRLCIDRFQNG